MIALLLSACFPRLDVREGHRPVPGDSADTGVPPDPPAIESVEPAEGTNAGGIGVVLRGTGLGPGAEVRFGGLPATVAAAEDDRLDVVLPSAPGVEGAVEVAVVTGGGSDSLSSGFRYWADATDRAIVLLRLFELRAAAGEPVGPTAEWVGVVANYVEATGARVADLVAAEADACDTPTATLSPVAGPKSIGLTDGKLSLELLPGKDGYAASLYREKAPVVAGLGFDLSAVEATWPTLALAEAVTVPAELVVTRPDFALGGLIVVEQLDLRWSAPEADWVWIGLAATSNGTWVHCVAENDGEFDVPAEALAALGDSAGPIELLLTVIAMRDTTTIVDADGGEVRASGGYGEFRSIIVGS